MKLNCEKTFRFFYMLLNGNMLFERISPSKFNWIRNNLNILCVYLSVRVCVGGGTSNKQETRDKCICEDENVKWHN